MSLNGAFPILQQEIYRILTELEKKGQDGEDTDEIKKWYALQMATAIHSYTLAASVTTAGSGPITGIAGTIPVTGACTTTSTGKLL